MLRVERIGKRLVSFTGLQKRALEEFYELGNFIVNSPTEFFSEIGEDLLLAASGIRAGDDGGSYMDVLAVGRQGEAVVVIIAPADEPSPLSRAMHAASRVAAWSPDEFSHRLGPERGRQLRSFLAERWGDLNKRQRVILLSEEFEPALLATSGWLARSYGVDLSCVKVTLAFDPTRGDEYLECAVVSGRPLGGERPEEVEQVVSKPPAPADPLEIWPTQEAPLVDEVSDTSADPHFAEPARTTAASANVSAPVNEPAVEEPAAAAITLDAPAADQPVDESSFLQTEAAPQSELSVDELFEPALAELAGAHKAPNRTDRRRRDRRDRFSSANVEVEYSGRAMAAGVLNYSPNGVGLSLHAPLPVGAAVTVRGVLRWDDSGAELVREGRVTHCKFSDNAFRLGVRFDPPVAG